MTWNFKVFKSIQKDSKSIKTDRILIRVFFSTYKTLFVSVGIFWNYANTRQRVKNPDIDPRYAPYIYIGYKKGLKKQDIPKSFVIYFTTENDWNNIVLRTWTGFQYPFQIDTSLYNLPLEIEVMPLSRLHYYSLEQYIKKEKIECFNTTRIKEEISAGNCKDSCIPINYRSLFRSSEIKTCVTYNDHFCALYSTFFYIKSKYLIIQFMIK